MGLKLVYYIFLVQILDSIRVCTGILLLLRMELVFIYVTGTELGRRQTIPAGIFHETIK